jgi:hypothetical protein
MSKLITVFGATGNQGGSVVKHILADPILSKGFKVRGITRDVSKPAAKSLSDQGVEMKTVRRWPNNTPLPINRLEFASLTNSRQI